MKSLPQTMKPLVLRTDFSDDTVWEAICIAIQQPSVEDGFMADVDFLSDPEYDGVTPGQVRSLLSQDSNHTFTFIFMVDRTTISHSEQPVLVMDLYDQPGRTFRVIPSEMWGVENNLSIANMDFADFADVADQGDGIFRGYE